MKIANILSKRSSLNKTPLKKSLSKISSSSGFLKRNPISTQAIKYSLPKTQMKPATFSAMKLSPNFNLKSAAVHNHSAFSFKATPARGFSALPKATKKAFSFKPIKALPAASTLTQSPIKYQTFHSSNKTLGGGFDPSKTDPQYVARTATTKDAYQSKLPLYATLGTAVGTLGLVLPEPVTLATDFLLAASVPIHSHLGLNLIIRDYVPNSLQTICRVLLMIATALTFVGLCAVAFGGPGIASTIKSLWFN